MYVFKSEAFKNKNGESYTSLNRFILAAFRPWGGSTGADCNSHRRKCNYKIGEIISIYFVF